MSYTRQSNTTLRLLYPLLDRLSDMQCPPTEFRNIAHRHSLSHILSSSDILPTVDQGDFVSLVVYIATDGPGEGRTSAMLFVLGTGVTIGVRHLNVGSFIPMS